MTASAAIRERIHRVGPVPFDEFMDLALYGDGGFFAGGGGAGRGRDFLTSPEVGPLFGAVLARALDAWWDDLGRPDPFVVVEPGAGVGSLARAVLAARPACAQALRYVLVERSDALREQHAGLPSEPPEVVLAAPPGHGPLTTSLPDLPATDGVHVVLANELLDNLPFSLMERTSAGWCEVRVGDDASGQGFAEVLVDASPELAAAAARLAPDAPLGGRIPLQRAASYWLDAALAAIGRGRVVLVDYADTTPSLANRPHRQWLRTYRAHGRGGDPLDAPGTQDITCEVAVDQLAAVRPPDADRSQADFLRAHGIDALVDAAASAWRERAHVGDLAALKHRSRVHEADALLDASGLGAFRVLEWHIH